MSSTPELKSCLVPGFIPSQKGGEIRLPTCVHCHVANSSAEGGTCALLCSFSRLAEVRPSRQTHTPFHVKLRPREPIEPSRERNLFVTLPVVNATTGVYAITA